MLQLPSNKWVLMPPTSAVTGLKGVLLVPSSGLRKVLMTQRANLFWHPHPPLFRSLASSLARSGQGGLPPLAIYLGTTHGTVINPSFLVNSRTRWSKPRHRVMNGTSESPLPEGQAADSADSIPCARGPYRPDYDNLTCAFYLVMIYRLHTSVPFLAYNYWLHVTSHSWQRAHCHNTSANAVSQGHLHVLKDSTHCTSLQGLCRVLELLLHHELANYQRIVTLVHAI